MKEIPYFVLHIGVMLLLLMVFDVVDVVIDVNVVDVVDDVFFDELNDGLEI